MSEQQWYYRSGGRPRGPVTGAELRRMAISGELKPTDAVRGPGMTKWLPAGDFEGLFPASKSVDDRKPGTTASAPAPTRQPVSPPAPQAPPVLPSTQLPPSSFPPAQETASFGFEDQGNPYAGFGLESTPQWSMPPFQPSSSVPSAPVSDSSYNPMATMNQQDILAMEATRASENAAAAGQRQGSYPSASYGGGSSRGSAGLQGIATCRWRMNIMFILYIFSTLFFYVLVIWCVVVIQETGAVLSARGAMTIVVVYLASFVPWIGMFYYVCRLAPLVGKSVVLYFIICFGAPAIAIILLGIEASRRLRGRRY